MITSRLTELLVGDWGLSKQLRLHVQDPTRMQVCKLNECTCIYYNHVVS